jgi:hypothetical protein
MNARVKPEHDMLLFPDGRQGVDARGTRLAAGREKNPAGPHTGFLWINWRAMMMRCNSLVPSPISKNGASR